jgi:hypothetical protein
MSNADLHKYQRFVRDAERSPDYWQEAAMIEFTEALCREMRRRHLSRPATARRLNMSVRKLVAILAHDDELIPVRTLVRCAMAVGGRLHMEITPREKRRA